MPATIYSLAPVTLTVSGGSTVTIPCESHGFTADILATPHIHSGNIAPTLIATPGANPKIEIHVPFQIALTTFGLGIVKLTALEVFLSTYLDYARDPAAHHNALNLVTGCFGAAQIVDWTVNVDGILMAVVHIDLLAAGQVHPFTLATGLSLPTLSGSPQLHTLGPIKINGTIIPGASSHSGSINGQTTVQRTDGDLYPRVAARTQIAPTIRIAHQDPVAVLTALGLLGTAITSTTELYFKAYDVSTGIVTDTNGIKIAVGAGRVIPDGWQANQGAVATTGLTVHGIVADGVSNPLVITTGVTVPDAT